MTTRAGWFTLSGVLLTFIGALLFTFADGNSADLAVAGLGLAGLGSPLLLAGLIGLCVDDSLRRRIGGRP